VGDSRNVGTGQNPINVPTFLSRKIEGVLRVRDGETNLLGGLVQGRDAVTLSGVLGLQSIPIIGRIFSSTGPTGATREDTEIVISLTPHLVRAPRLVDEDLSSLYVGSAEQVRVPSARPPLFGNPEEPPMAPVPIPGPTPAPTPTPPPDAGAAAATPARPTPPGAGIESGAPSVPAGERRSVTAAVSPSEASLKTGETASISMVLLNVQDLIGMEMVLSYDPALLEVADVGAGPLLTLDGAAVGVERNLEPGRARAKFSRATGASGSGMVATVTIRALRQGAGAVTVDSLSIVTVTGSQQVGIGTPVRVVVSP
jgi:general secretion pathway protein D